MRLIHLSTFLTILLDIAAWFVIHMAVVLVSVRLPIRWFTPEALPCRPRDWEKTDALYRDFFRIRRWKDRLPDGAEFFGEHGFPKKRLRETNSAHLHAFACETCRAEMTHWVIILAAPLFFLWNRLWVGWFMIFYALAENIPFILVQRYNRIRLMRVLRRRGFKIPPTTDAKRHRLH